MREAATAYAEKQPAATHDRPPPRAATAPPDRGADDRQPQPREWPLYEVFVRGKRGLNHVHVGSLHAADDEMALRHARDLYTRRNEGVSIWVVRADAITASSPDEKDPFFAPSGDKVYRHPTFYDDPRRRPPHVTDLTHDPRRDDPPRARPAPDPNDAHGSVFDGLLGSDSSQWAFGTDFEDPLAGVDTHRPGRRRRRPTSRRTA